MGLRARQRGRAMRAVFVLATVALVGAALVGATGAGAGTTVSETAPADYAGMNSCTGETFMGSGMMHFLESTNVSTSGALNYDLNVRFDGIQAVTPSGKKYVVQDIFYDHFVIAGASEATFDITAHYIRVGEDGTFILGDDFYEYLRTHITANANGMVTAFTVNASDMPCQ